MMYQMAFCFVYNPCCEIIIGGYKCTLDAGVSAETAIDWNDSSSYKTSRFVADEE